MLHSTRALLGAIVDYGGPFPPAGPTLADALDEYALRRTGADAWLLGRFVISFSGLDEFDRLASRSLTDRGGPWELSVVLPGKPEQPLRQLETFNRQWLGKARITSVEFPPLQ